MASAWTAQGRAVGGDGESLKNRNRIQIAGLPGAAARPRSPESKLAAGRSVGRIAQEVKTEQRVIVKHAVRSADDGLTIALGVARKAHARLEIVLVGLNALLQSEQIVGGQMRGLAVA